MTEEIKKIIRDNNLSLTVKDYINSSAVVITDWDYWYHHVKYCKSDLKKFREILSSKYSKTYQEINAGVGGSIVLTRRLV